MKRRALLAAAPAVLAAGVAPAAPVHIGAQPDGDTPILRLFRRREALMEPARQDPSLGDDYLEQLYYRQADELEDAMMALPCTCAADFAAKMITDTCYGELFTSWESGDIWKEARALVGWEETDRQGGTEWPHGRSGRQDRAGVI